MHKDRGKQLDSGKMMELLSAFRPRLSQSVADEVYEFLSGYYGELREMAIETATMAVLNKPRRKVIPEFDDIFLAQVSMAYADGFACAMGQEPLPKSHSMPAELGVLTFGGSVWSSEPLPDGLSPRCRCAALAGAVSSEMDRVSTGCGEPDMGDVSEWRVRVLVRTFLKGAARAEAAVRGGSELYPVPPLVGTSEVAAIVGQALSSFPGVSKHMSEHVAKKTQAFNLRAVSKPSGACPMTHDRATAEAALSVYAFGYISGLLGTDAPATDDDDMLYAFLEGWRESEDLNVSQEAMDRALSFALTSSPRAPSGLEGLSGFKVEVQTSYIRRMCMTSYLEGASWAATLRAAGCTSPLQFDPENVDEEPETAVGRFKPYSTAGAQPPRELVNAIICYEPADNALAVIVPGSPRPVRGLGWMEFSDFAMNRLISFSDPAAEAVMSSLLERYAQAAEEHFPESPQYAEVPASLVWDMGADDVVLVGRFKDSFPAPEEYWGCDIAHSPSQEPPFGVIFDEDVIGTLDAEAFPRIAALGVVDFADPPAAETQVPTGAADVKRDREVFDDDGIPVIGSVTELKRLLGMHPEESLQQTIEELDADFSRISVFSTQPARRRRQQVHLAKEIYSKAHGAAMERLERIGDVGACYDEVPYCIVFPRALTVDASGCADVYSELLDVDGEWVEGYLREYKEHLPAGFGFDALDYDRLAVRVTETIAEILEGGGLYSQKASDALADVLKFRQERDFVEAFKPKPSKQKLTDRLSSYARARVRAADVLYRNTEDEEDFYKWYPQYFLAPALSEALGGSPDPLWLLVENFDDDDIVSDMRSAKKHLRCDIEFSEVDIGRVRREMSAYLEQETGYKTLEIYRLVAEKLSEASGKNS